MTRPALQLDRDDSTKHHLVIQLLFMRVLLMLPTLVVLGIGIGLIIEGTTALRDSAVDASLGVRIVTMRTVHDEVSAFMALPVQWCSMAYSAWLNGHFPISFHAPANYSQAVRYLFDDMKSHITAEGGSAPAMMYVATRQGRMLGYEYNSRDQSLSSLERLQPQEGSLKLFFRNFTDNTRGAVVDEWVRYNPTQRVWFQQAAFYRPGQRNWTDVYLSADGQMAITAVTKLAYGIAEKDWQGVAASDHPLSNIAVFLQRARPTSRSNLFLFEKTGTLVASSYSTPLSRYVGSTLTRYTILNSPIKEVTAAARHLQRQFKSFASIPDPYNAEVDLDGEPTFLDSKRIMDDYGLSWVVVLLIPQEDLLQSLDSQGRRLLVITILLVVGVTIVSVSIALCIIRPMRDLRKHLEWQDKDLTVREAELAKLKAMKRD
eukprot:Sspe_Gene.106473::Locus_84554_Transcript_1_1_Confidence_1.000_Length_1465::g.106473::m.106473